MFHPQVPQTSRSRSLNEDQLLEEIAWYENRLAEIAGSDECAYDKALARAYEQAMHGHREKVAALRQLHR